MLLTKAVYLIMNFITLQSALAQQKAGIHLSKCDEASVGKSQEALARQKLITC